MVFIPSSFFITHARKQYFRKSHTRYEEIQKQRIEKEFNKIYEHFSQWNLTFCSHASYHRGRHQKVISISVYGKESKFIDNQMYSWKATILPFFEPLVSEMNQLLPQWILRVYIDFTGSTKSQRKHFYKFSNVDICDMNNIPMFGSSLHKFLPGRMWRFLPIFDPYVDYLLSHDLDSPITERETETIKIWLSKKQEKNFFYIARDHIEHSSFILGGLWGASLIRARHTLVNIFKPMLIPSIVQNYHGNGDQKFLNDYVEDHVRNHSLIFDSYFCEILDGQPFLSQRPMDGCYLGCLRPCCNNVKNARFRGRKIPCPTKCRPKDHLDWIYC
ncbi:unnamed protein product [Rotaria sp. Silwood2]|nr:unnamed protein product [Rotaria sp. Silwood2]